MIKSISKGQFSLTISRIRFTFHSSKCFILVSNELQLLLTLNFVNFNVKNVNILKSPPCLF